MFEQVKKQDPLLAGLLEQEVKRQKETIDLIPSECLVSSALMEVLGSPLSNKYSEGEVGKRYYPGNRWIDEIELLAKKRALKAFGLADGWQVNVQCLSGAPANLAVYFGLLEPGQTIMGMNLFCGGHLSHGHKAHLSGRVFNSVQYGVGHDEKIDFSEVEKLAKEHRPKIIISGFTAYPFQINFERFGQIAKEIDAWHMADISHIAGLISAGVHPSPFPYVDIVTTTTHKTLNGPRAALVFMKDEIAHKIKRSVFPGIFGGPHNNKIGAIALALGLTQTESFKKTQET